MTKWQQTYRLDTKREGDSGVLLSLFSGLVYLLGYYLQLVAEVV